LRTMPLDCHLPKRKAMTMLGTALTESITTDVAVKLKGSTTQTNWQKKPPKVKKVIVAKNSATQLKWKESTMALPSAMLPK